MICKNCGANNPDGVVLCRSCNERISVSAEIRKNQQMDKQKEINKQLEKRRALEQRINKEESVKKQYAMSKILISSCYNFEGYTIVEYSDYISGDDAMQIQRSETAMDNNRKNLTDALGKIRQRALNKLKETAYDLGCNAIIGVDFDYITLSPETAQVGYHVLEPYVICVTANGTAVVIEKNQTNTVV